MIDEDDARCGLRVAGYVLRGARYRVRVAECGLRGTRCAVRVYGQGAERIEQGDLEPQFLSSEICFLSSAIWLRGTGLCGLTIFH